jgi:oxygen-independent coproporphyrinogen-3 oxidase
MTEDWRNGGFGLYVHWPFCASKCPYCDFNSHVSAEIDESRWNRAFFSEIERVGKLTEGRVLNSVFFGGGTPSLMSPELVNSILDKVRKTWTFANDIEITLEANPTSIEAGRFRGYSEAGVNRVSMGMQALNDLDLRALGRMHTAEEGRKAFDIARTQFDRVSFDLIYARQNQDIDHWRHELNEALSMAVDHFSLYQLTVEDGTAFGARHAVGKLRGLPTDDLAADMYLATQDICGEAGLPAYEVSNHARAGAESRHNLIYWRYGDYAGIGPGAHGRLTIDGKRHSTDTPKAPNDWLERVEAHGAGEIEFLPLSYAEQAIEYLLFNLRLTEGLDTSRFEAMSGTAFDAQTVRDLEKMGMIEAEDHIIRATAGGRAVLNAVIRELMP